MPHRHQTYLFVSVFLILPLCHACSSKTKNSAHLRPKQETRSKAHDATKKKTYTLPTPPPERLATPSLLVAKKLHHKPIGTLETSLPGQKKETHKLMAIGVAPCYNGWGMIPFTKTADGAAVPGQPMLLTHSKVHPKRDLEATILGTMPAHKVIQNYTHFSPSRIAGTWSWRVKSGDKEIHTQAHFDGAPTPLSSGMGLGLAGCFSTGHFKATFGTQTLLGTAVGHIKNRKSYHLHFMLDDAHAITVLIDLEAHRRQEGMFIDEDLSKIFKNFKDFPLRAFFETKEQRPLTKHNTKDIPTTHVVWGQSALKTGHIKIHFAQKTIESPITIELQQVSIPKGFSTFTQGATLKHLRAVITPVTDPKGIRVPHTKPPKWWK